MKSTAIFIGVLFGLSFLASGAMLVTATMKPQWFMIGAQQQATADSLRAQATADSLARIARADSMALPGLHAEDTHKDTMSAPSEIGNGHAVPENRAAAEAVTPVQTEAARQEELQSLVKLYDAMKPEDAARILAKQEDKDIRAIILHVKKKQAAKILSFFNADRAAQILSQ